MEQQSSKQRAEAEVLDLKGKLRQLNQTVASKGVPIDENAPLVETIKAVEALKTGHLTLFKKEQLYAWEDETLPPMKVKEGANVSLRYSFASMKNLKEFPDISGSERVTDISYICNASSALTSFSIGDLPLVSDASYAFKYCDSLERITIGDIGGRVTFEDFARFCPKLRELTIGSAPNTASINSIVESCPLIEEVTASFGDQVNNVRYAFQGCNKLRRINGVLNFGNTTDYTGVFTGCFSLEEVRIKGLRSWIDLSPCRSLSLESLRYLIENAQRVTGQGIYLSRKLLEAYEEELLDLGDTASDKGWILNYR